MAIGGMGPDQEHDSVLQTIVLDIFKTDVIIEHEMSEEFYGEDQFLVVQWFLNFQLKKVREVARFEIINNLSLGGPQ
jgi:hypothetical protein